MYYKICNTVFVIQRKANPMQSAKQMTDQLVENIKAAIEELKKHKGEGAMLDLLIDFRIAELDSKLKVVQDMQAKFNKGFN